MKELLIIGMNVCIAVVTFAQSLMTPISQVDWSTYYTNYSENWRPLSVDYMYRYSGDSVLINFITDEPVVRNLDSAKTYPTCTRLELVNQRIYNHFEGLERLSRLQYLNLTYSQNRDKAIKELPVGLYSLDSLRILWASNANIQYISYQIRNLSQLQYINLAKNHLRALPEEIGELTNLEYLDLSGNQLSNLPDSFSKLNKLKYLNLQGNPIRYSIADQLANLDSLEFLYFSMFRNARAVNENLESIKNHKKLKVLFLRYNNLIELPTVLGELDQVKELSLRGNFDLDWDQAFEVLSQMDSLKVLDLSFCRLEKLPESFSKLNQVETVYLGNFKWCCPLINWAGERPHNHVSKFPKSVSHLKGLKNLYLWSFGYSDNEKKRISKLFPDVNIEFDFASWESLDPDDEQKND